MSPGEETPANRPEDATTDVGSASAAVDEKTTNEEPPSPPPVDTTAPATDKAPSERRTTIVVALIALGGVLLGGTVAAASSYATARMTIDSQQQQSLQQYRRDKRHDIYVNLLTQLTSLETTLNQIELSQAKLQYMVAQLGDHPAPPPEKPPPAPPDLTKQNDDKWQTAYESVNAAITAAEVVSTRKIIELSKALRDAYSGEYYHSAFPGLIEGLKEGEEALGQGPSIEGGTPASGPPLPPPEYDPALLRLPIWKLKDQFIQEAKTEIDLND